MRTSIFALLLIALVAFSTPAQAQLRSIGAPRASSVQLYDGGGTGFSLNRFFSPEHFAMSHSFELSSFGGSSMSMYTNTMQWQFNSKLAARVDVAAAYSPLGSQSEMSVTGNSDSRVFVKRADFAYRPKENVELRLSFRQNPMNMYMNRYGSGGYPYNQSGGSSFMAEFGPNNDNLFWNGR
jgi:hypothetical protein